MDHDRSYNEFNRKFLNDVFPPDWKNPKATEPYEILIVGGGPGGMTAATIARSQHAKVAIVEKEHLGGESLSAGCIPSKAMIRSSRFAAEVRRARDFGLEIPDGWKVDFRAVMQRVYRSQTTLSPTILLRILRNWESMYF
jgi:pyruvate/2-oxoglutarate dehydrogenase complex dihydrolipoamide dehydrogenase (E3) component